jgi:hypothetical protein
VRLADDDVKSALAEIRHADCAVLPFLPFHHLKTVPPCGRETNDTEGERCAFMEPSRVSWRFPAANRWSPHNRPRPSQVPTTRVIEVGEEVSDELDSDRSSSTGFIPAVTAIAYELTAPSDGTLVVRLDWEVGSLSFSNDLGELSYFPNWWTPITRSP